MDFLLGGPRRAGTVSGILMKFSCWFWAAGWLAREQPHWASLLLCSHWAPFSPELSEHQKAVSTNIFPELQAQLVLCSPPAPWGGRGTDSGSLPQSGFHGSCSRGCSGLGLPLLSSACSLCLLLRFRLQPPACLASLLVPMSSLGAGLVITCRLSLGH